eukprot:TRINITY_DN14036_c0_g3_i1.p1 TRINITY_DN14036_c0_g3~~TRINITY_DN14036_c0_g3_i1.p1  ORF type:complete len:209 (-),score=40.77 TRINITY_DN14036_c0_g3_i1:91-717(-)
MASTRGALMHATPKRGIGLSDAAEQRWHQMTGGMHLLPAVAGLSEEDVQNNVCNQMQPVLPLAQAMGLAEASRSMQQERNNLPAPAFAAPVPRQANMRSGVQIAAAVPTQLLSDEWSQDPNAPPLPPSLQRLVDAGPFVPPAGEEWHILNGWHVRISRSELDALLARAEASESEEEEDDGNSRADTSVGRGSHIDSEDGESTDVEELA